MWLGSTSLRTLIKMRRAALTTRRRVALVAVRTATNSLSVWILPSAWRSGGAASRSPSRRRRTSRLVRESFWTGGFGLAPGAVTSFGTIGNHGNIGIFTTGLTAIYSLKNWVPANYGGWYVRGGFQWYDIINQNLRIDNGIAVNNSNSSVWVGFVGLGVSF